MFKPIGRAVRSADQENFSLPVKNMRRPSGLFPDQWRYSCFNGLNGIAF